MKKILVYTFIIFYLVNWLKPFAPTVYSYISKTIWKHEHQNRLNNMDGRINFLAVLADIAKHNNPKQDSNTSPDSFKQAPSFFACIVPKLNSQQLSTTSRKVYFAFYNDTEYFVFRQLSTPPPKFV